MISFSMMADAESPQTAWDFIWTRLRHNKLLFITYDNGCQLVHYIFNRWPQIMKFLFIYIDPLHSKNHVNCLADYCTSACSTKHVTVSIDACTNLAYLNPDQTPGCVCIFDSEALTPLPLCPGQHRAEGLSIFQDGPLPERQNLVIDAIRVAAAHMSQETFLWQLALIANRINGALERAL